MNLKYRKAIPEDANECITLRGSTRENSYSIEELAEVGITLETWRNGIHDGDFPGYVCLDNKKIVGMCFGHKDSGEILVVAILPDYENLGIGKNLLELTIKELKLLGHNRIFLGCNSNSSSRSYGFYRHLGWTSTGSIDSNGDEILELFV